MLFVLLFPLICATYYPISFERQSDTMHPPTNLSITLQNTTWMHLTSETCVTLVQLDAPISNHTTCAQYVDTEAEQSAVFFLIPRPDWTYGDTPSPGGVFVDGTQVLRVLYYPKPQLGVITDYSREIGVRTTFRAGWSSLLAEILCTNCSHVNFVSVKPYIPNTQVCQSRPETHNAFAPLSTAFQFPFETHPEQSQGQVIFWTSADISLPFSFRSAIFKRPLTVCFYEDRHKTTGTPIGSVEFDYDASDSEMLMLIILMAVVCFPMLAVLSAVCTAAKMKRVHERLREIRDLVQTRQLEQELLLIARNNLSQQ